jgi:hypothetical protein
MPVLATVEPSRSSPSMPSVPALMVVVPVRVPGALIHNTPVPALTRSPFSSAAATFMSTVAAPSAIVNVRVPPPRFSGAPMSEMRVEAFPVTLPLTVSEPPNR